MNNKQKSLMDSNLHIEIGEAFACSCLLVVVHHQGTRVCSAHLNVTITQHDMKVDGVTGSDTLTPSPLT